MKTTSVADASVGEGSYRSVLKATTLLGGASAINMLVGIFRAKAVALLLGASGMGVMGIYLSISGLATTLASCGLNYSGVRELAEAGASEDEERIRRTLKTFRSMTLWLAFLGTAALAACAWPVSVASFGNSSYAAGTAFIALTVALNLIGNYHVAVIQASGRAARVASYNVISGVMGSLIAVVIFLLMREDGIIPALMAGALVQALLAMWLARGHTFPKPGAATSFAPEIARRMLKVGVLMVGIGFLAGLALFLVRAIIVRSHGEAGAGLFQAAYGLSGMYAGYILGAMGTDFLPRLSAVSTDHAKMNTLINEQTVVALWMGLPGVVVTIVMAPLLIPLFYSQEFKGAIPALQWMAVGVFGRLLSWPLSFSLIVRNQANWSLLGELTAHGVHLLVLWFTLSHLGLSAAGVASVVSYAVYTLMLYRLLHAQTGQSWSRDVWAALSGGIVLILSVLVTSLCIPHPWQWVFGGCLIVLSCLLSIKCLSEVSGVTHSAVIRRLNSLFGMRRPVP